MRVDERIFTYLLAEKLPELTDHFSECDISLTNLTFHWLPLSVYQCITIRSDRVYLVIIGRKFHSRDRIFYFGSHVVHASAMSIFIHYQKELMRLSDLEEIVVFYEW